MFKFFKGKTDNYIYAPVGGECMDITEVKDPAFASKMMGDGLAIIPNENIIKAPCDGELTAVFHTGHAFGITADNGIELLIHIGIDTVSLDGKGFKILKQKGSRVKKGEAIIEVDFEMIKKEFDTTTMIIVTNEKEFGKLKLQGMTDEGEPIMEVK